MLNLNLNTNFSRKPSAFAFVSEFQTVYDSWTIKPDDSDAELMNSMVKEWVDNGFWDSQDFIHVTSIHTNTNGEAQINWKDPGTYDLILVANGGTMNFTAFEGFQSSNGSYFRIDSYNPGGTGTYKYTQNSASFGCYSRTNVNEAIWDIGVRDNNAWASMALRLASNFTLRLNDLTSDNDSTTADDSRGWFIGYRQNASTKQGDKNKTQIIDTTTVSTAIPNGEWFAMALNRVGIGPSTLSTKQFSLFFSGQYINKTIRDSAYDSFQSYMTSKSKQV